jgi:hypothetical protein
MSSYIEKEGVKVMPWSTFFQRTADVPLDRSSMFSSIEDARKYAKHNELDPDTRNLVSSSYIGQIITVYENNEVNVYKINANRELEAFGSGNGVKIINNESELNNIINNVGQFIYNLENKTMYFVSEEGKNNVLFSFNNGITTLDAGTY